MRWRWGEGIILEAKLSLLLLPLPLLSLQMHKIVRMKLSTGNRNPHAYHPHLQGTGS